MVFSSLTFLLLFLPSLLVIYFAIPVTYRKARNMILLWFSVLFYAWGEPVYVLLIILCVGMTYLLSGRVEQRQKWALTASIVMNLMPLFLFKYLDFIVANLNEIPGVRLPYSNLALPIGISFYTFQALTYVIDLYRGQVTRQKNPLNLALYIFLFPQLIAGPIVRYATVEQQIEERRENWEDFLAGLGRFVVGLAKKVLIANQAGYIVHAITREEPQLISSGFMWLAVFAFAIQIYFDFSGYSDMAIGLGRMFGFRFLENFNYPYVSRSVTEFWRRWHMSLSSFFRDYVYIPMGGNRVPIGRWLANILFVWMLTGAWHGAFWNYILWGVYYGVVLVIEKLLLRKVLEKLPLILSWAYAFLMTLFGWAIFMTETNSLAQLGDVFGKLLFIAGTDTVLTIRALELQPYIPYLIAGFVLSFPIAPKSKQVKWLHEGRLAGVLADAAMVALFVASITYIVAESFNPFIYFRF